MATETKATHTPGPWGNYKWNCHEHQISAFGGTVALVSHDHSLISDESADANARLIAAAPDLLELLIESLPSVEESEQFNKPSCRTLSKRIRAAIAKAADIQ